MTKFGSAFMKKSPLYKHGEKLKEEAMRLSKESSGRDDAPDYDNPKVVELLDQAKEANKSHRSTSPFQGAYSSGADGMVYVSNRNAFKQLQDDIVSGAKTSIKTERQNKKYQDYKNLPDNEFTVKYGMNKEDYIAAINKANKEKKQDGNA